MSEELARLARPEATSFKGKKKLYVVPLMLTWPEAPPDYREKFNLYWQQVAEHLAHLEDRIGRISHVFHESVYQSGEEAFRALEKFSPASLAIIKEKCQAGAVFEVGEDREIFQESLDWERFLMMGFANQKAANIVSENYANANRERYRHIAAAITAALKEDEAGVLFIHEGSPVQFPAELEVFSVAPMALDDIHRWLRDRPMGETPLETEPAGEEPPPS